MLGRNIEKKLKLCTNDTLTITTIEEYEWNITNGNYKENIKTNQL